MQSVNIDYASIIGSSTADLADTNHEFMKLNPKQSGGGDEYGYDDDYADHDHDHEHDDDHGGAFDNAETEANTAANAIRISGGAGGVGTGWGRRSDDVSEDGDGAESDADADEDDDDDDHGEPDESDDDNEGDQGDEDDEEGGKPKKMGLRETYAVNAGIEDDGDEDEGHDDDDGGDDDDDDAECDDDADDDDICDADKFKKFNQKMRTNYLVETHPESTSHNDDEIHSLAHVVRDKTGEIIDLLHRTIPILTKYEKTRILGVRTRQLNDGAVPYVKVEKSIIDGYIIALRELDEKKIPFIVRRPLPNGGSEYWYLQDLEVI